MTLELHETKDKKEAVGIAKSVDGVVRQGWPNHVVAFFGLTQYLMLKEPDRISKPVKENGETMPHHIESFLGRLIGSEREFLEKQKSKSNDDDESFDLGCRSGEKLKNLEKLSQRHHVVKAMICIRSLVRQLKYDPKNKNAMESIHKVTAAVTQAKGKDSLCSKVSFETLRHNPEGTAASEGPNKTQHQLCGLTSEAGGLFGKGRMGLECVTNFRFKIVNEEVFVPKHKGKSYLPPRGAK